MKYKAHSESFTSDDDIPLGSVIIAKGIIEVSTDEGEPYNKYVALVYLHDGKRFAVYLDKARKVFCSVEVID